MDHAQRHGQLVPRHAEALFEQSAAGFRGVPGGAELDRGQGRSHGADRIDRGASLGELLVLGPDRPVEGVGIIAERDRGQTEIAEHAFQVPEIGGRDDPGQKVHALVLRALLGQAMDQGPDCGVEAFGVGPRVTRRGDVDHFRQMRTFDAELAKEHFHVLSDGLGQAGRGDADQPRRVLPRHVLQPETEVLLSTEDRRRLAEVRRSDIQRFFEMADHVTANIGGTPLRSVQEGDRSLDAPERQAGAQGAQSLQALRVAVKDAVLGEGLAIIFLARASTRATSPNCAPRGRS